MQKLKSSVFSLLQLDQYSLVFLTDRRAVEFTLISLVAFQEECLWLRITLNTSNILFLFSYPLHKYVSNTFIALYILTYFYIYFLNSFHCCLVTPLKFFFLPLLLMSMVSTVRVKLRWTLYYNCVPDNYQSFK